MTAEARVVRAAAAYFGFATKVTLAGDGFFDACNTSDFRCRGSHFRWGLRAFGEFGEFHRDRLEHSGVGRAMTSRNY